PAHARRNTAIISSKRAARVVHSTWLKAYSSGTHESPTPSDTRPSASAAIDVSCLATRSGWRIGSFTTLVVSPMVVVAAANAASATNGSTEGESGAQKRCPSGEPWYLAETCSG